MENKLHELEELLSHEITKAKCKEINRLRSSIDGYFLDSCFCTSSQRKAFVRETKYWLDGQLGKSRGLGDTVAKITKFFGIEPCPECKERQDKWNKDVPYDTSRD